MDEQPLLHPPLKKFGFIHVPKCAGRSVRAAVRPHYPDGEIFGDRGQSMPKCGWDGISCILEHVQYRYMMDAHGMVFATVLRHPVDIEQSWINFMLRRRREDRLESRFRYWLAAAERNLDRYIETHITDGKMIDYFWTDPDNQEQSAINILEHLDLVGFQDDFAKFIEGLSKLLEVELPVLHENISPQEIVFTPKQRALVAWKTRRDCAFYRYARALYRKADDVFEI